MFLCYNALETTAGLWASSYLVLVHDVPAERAAALAGLFYLGITAGRFSPAFPEPFSPQACFPSRTFFCAAVLSLPLPADLMPHKGRLTASTAASTVWASPTAR